MGKGIRVNWIELGLAAGVFLVITGSAVALGNPLLGAIAVCGAALLIFLGAAPKRLLYALIGYSMVVKFLIGDLGISSIANYVCDGLLLLVLLLALLRPREGYTPLPCLRHIGLVLLAFWFVATVSALLNGVDFVLYAWACRNTFRLFGIFYCCIRLFNRDDIFRLVSLLTVFFWVNIVVCAFQYFVLGTGQDNTNGFFGTGSGGNAMMVILMFVVSSLSLFGYSSNKKTLMELVLTFVACCFLAVIAELKVYFVLLVLLITFAVLLNRFSFRNITIVVLSVVVLLVGVQLVEMLYPNFAGFFSLENIIDNSFEGSYSNQGTLNRLSAVETISTMFLGDGIERALGLGFGSGQFTQFFESSLYEVWGEILHWTWFTDAAIVLETGYIGLALYAMVFVLMAVQITLMRKCSGTDKWLVSACASIAVLCLVLIVYNCSLTVDPSCYFTGVVLAFPYVLRISGEIR